MKVGQISSYSGVKNQYSVKSLKNKAQNPIEQNSNVGFKGKHDGALTFGGIAGALGSAGAIGGTIIMTGGVVLPAVLAYGAFCAATGAVFGHQVDKYIEKENKKDQNK